MKYYRRHFDTESEAGDFLIKEIKPEYGAGVYIEEAETIRWMTSDDVDYPEWEQYRIRDIPYDPDVFTFLKECANTAISNLYNFINESPNSLSPVLMTIFKAALLKHTLMFIQAFGDKPQKSENITALLNKVV